MTVTKLAVLVAAILMLPVTLRAGEKDKTRKYQIGGRSALILGEMPLSKIAPSFDDLSTAGLKGAHHSGLYFVQEIKPNVRFGLETLVGNSNEKAKTTMNFQGLGATANFIYGRKLFLSGGLHAGGIIVNAQQREGAASDNRAQSGTHFKSSGFFLAPFAGLGLRVRNKEISLFIKHVSLYASKAQGPLEAFNSLYAGLGYGVNL